MSRVSSGSRQVDVGWSWVLLCFEAPPPCPRPALFRGFWEAEQMGREWSLSRQPLPDTRALRQTGSNYF